MKKFTIQALALSVLTACGGGGGGGGSSSGDTNNENDATKGFFLDSFVQGLNYSSPSYSGVTDGAGSFNYEAGETTTFTFQGLTIGSIVMQDTKPSITPLDIFNASDVNDQRVKNTLVLLQSLDNDQDPSNGISLPEVLLVDAPLSGLDISSSTFQSDLSTTWNNNVSSLTFVDEADAIDHFEDTLASLQGVPSLAGISWLLRNQQDGDVSAEYTFNENGTLTLIEYDDCPSNLWAANKANAVAQCTQVELSMNWTLANGVLTMINDELEDICYIQLVSSESITAVCDFQGSGLGTELITFENTAAILETDLVSSFNPTFSLSAAVQVYDGSNGKCKEFYNFDASLVALQPNGGSEYICDNTLIGFPNGMVESNVEIIDGNGANTGIFYDVVQYTRSGSTITFVQENKSCDAIYLMKFSSSTAAFMTCSIGQGESFIEIWRSN